MISKTSMSSPIVKLLVPMSTKWDEVEWMIKIVESISKKQIKSAQSYLVWPVFVIMKKIALLKTFQPSKNLN